MKISLSYNCNNMIGKMQGLFHCSTILIYRYTAAGHSMTVI